MDLIIGDLIAKAISRYSSLEKSCAAKQKASNPNYKLDLLHPVPVNYVRLLFGGETTSLDIEIRVGNNSVAAGKNPICKWETGRKESFKFIINFSIYIK